jgi:hypothetical protein
MARRRVLYTVNRMDVGGSQTHLIQVLRLLDRERFEPILCCLTGKERCSTSRGRPARRCLPAGSTA